MVEEANFGGRRQQGTNWKAQSIKAFRNEELFFSTLKETPNFPPNQTRKMTSASHIIKYSRKMRNTSNIIRCEHSILVRWFSNDTSKLDDVWKIRNHGNLPLERELVMKPVPSMSFLRQCHRNISSTTTNVSYQNNGLTSIKKISCSQVNTWRWFSSGSDLPAHQEIGMPSLSPTMTEGNIARWLKKEGDKVSPGEVLCEVETDKATVEMECMEEGYLAKILRGDGEKEIKVGEVIAITVEDGEDIAKFNDYKPTSSDAAATPAKESSSPPKKEVVDEPVQSPPEPKTSKPSNAASKPSEAAPVGGRIFATPLARTLAEKENVPLSSIKGTGPDGSIVKADVEEYLASSGKETSVAAPAAKSKGAASAPLGYTDIPHSQIRKVTASRLLFSKQTIPHYYLTVDACVDKLMDLRSQLNSLQEASGGKRISVNDLVIKAAALALRKVPQCNSSWTDDCIRQYHNININVAVQTDNGLYVPVIRDADKKGLSKIGEEVKQLAQKAKVNSLKPEDYEGGTFTVSNLGGPFGIKQFCAIINPPQSGILAIGSAEKRVVPGSVSEQFQFASFMSATLSCDHRVIDGAIGAEWLKAFKGYIENPESMLL